MAYTPQTWTDGMAGGTPLVAARLNHIEAGLQSAAAAADAAGGIAYVVVETGAETRPAADVVLWLAPTGVTPTNRGPHDPLLEIPTDEARFSGKVALWGDSLVEGMVYTSSFAATVGQQINAGAALPLRYWIPSTVDEYCTYAVSNRDYNSVDWTFNGVPFSHYVETGENCQWPLSGGPQRVRVFFRRDNGSEANWSSVTVTVTSQSGGSVSTTATEPEDWAGVEHLDLDYPGGWVRVASSGGRFQVLGVEVITSTSGAGNGVYAFGQSGLDSDGFKDLVHEYRSWSSLAQNLGIDRVLISIMDNDAGAGVSTSVFRANIDTAVASLGSSLPGVPVWAVEMPNVGGRNLAPYNAQLVAATVGAIDATSMILDGSTVGGDGTHWTDAGNQAFAALLRDGLVA